MPSFETREKVAFLAIFCSMLLSRPHDRASIERVFGSERMKGQALPGHRDIHNTQQQAALLGLLGMREVVLILVPPYIYAVPGSYIILSRLRDGLDRSRRGLSLLSDGRHFPMTPNSATTGY
ncbi:hypothetical protein BDW72DRAFT_179143 [Aspergillus terricola var. indicus]